MYLPHGGAPSDSQTKGLCGFRRYIGCPFPARGFSCRMDYCWPCPSPLKLLPFRGWSPFFSARSFRLPEHSVGSKSDLLHVAQATFGLIEGIARIADQHKCSKAMRGCCETSA